MRLPRLVCATLLLLALGLSNPSPSAAWPHDPIAGNVPVCTAAGDQFAPAMCSDGLGGFFTTWYDFRGATLSDIYVQHMDANGNALWTANGVLLCNATSYQAGCRLAPDGAGGVIVAWYDYRSGTGYDIYAQRVNAAGVPQWTANGVLVCNAAVDQTEVRIATDGAGGAYLCWHDIRSGTNYDIYAQRLTALGAAAWAANGIVIANAANDQWLPAMIPDGAGSAIISWQDSRSGTSDIYAQKITASGLAAWTAGGVAACAAVNGQSDPVLTTDGAGGCYIAWLDGRSGTNNDVYAQHIVSGGQLGWGANCLAICTEASNQTTVAIGADGAGGATIAWGDLRNAVDSDLYAQHVGPGGLMTTAVNGVALATASSSQSNPVVCSDGAGGAIVAWTDARSGVAKDIFAQRMGPTGTTLWTSGGVAVCTALGGQQDLAILPDNDGGAFLTWDDPRPWTNYDIYAQHVDHFGQLGEAEPVISGIKDVLNDQGGFVKLNWNGSYLDADPTYGILEYRVFRSAPSALAANGARRAVTQDSDVAAAEGALLVLPNSAAATYWEFVGSQTAEALGTYSKVVATTADSVPGSFPRTQFMIEARTSTSLSSPRWFSAPDSGYSVDNLAPAAPAPLTGQYAAGTTTLHWHRNTEADLAGYRLYRGTTVAFVPGTANFVTALADTGAADAAGAPYVYKLTAIDSHGNESPVATLVPTGTLGVSDAAASLSFAAPSPNPAQGSTTLRFSLGHAGPVRLSVYDAAGRRVQTLHDGALEAGAHTVAFALRDDAGHPLPSGLYLVRLEAEGRVITRRLAAVR